MRYAATHQSKGALFMNYVYVALIVLLVAGVQQILNNRRFKRHMKLHELQDISIDAAHDNTVYVLKILDDKGFPVSKHVSKEAWLQ